MATSIEHIEHVRHLRPTERLRGGLAISGSESLPGHGCPDTDSEAAACVRIAYSTDMDGFEPTLVSMMSALEGTRRPVAVHFIGYGLTDEALHRLETAARSHPQTELHLYNAYSERFGGRTGFNYPHVSMAILQIPKLLAGRVVYLDADTLVHGDIGNLFDTELQGHCIGAVRDYGTLREITNRLPEDRGGWVTQEKELMHPHPHTDFINSGVVLLDNDRIRSLPGLAESMTDEMGLGGDQNVLNLHMKGRTFHLDPSWNAIAGIYNTYIGTEFAATGAVTARATPARITHFCGPAKPWHDFDPDDLMTDLDGVRERVFLEVGWENRDDMWKLFKFLPDIVCVAEYVEAAKSWRRARARLMSVLDDA